MARASAQRAPAGFGGREVGARNQSAGVQRVTDFSLASMIDYRRDVMRNQKAIIIGKLYGITFGPSDGAAYEKAGRKHDKAPGSNQPPRANQLMLEWPEEQAPVVGKAAGGIFVFPVGIVEPPKVKDIYINVIQDPHKPAPEVMQDIVDLADGYIAGRDGSQFLVLQPITSMILRVVKTFQGYKGYVDPATGMHPALLLNPVTHEAHIVGGILY